MAPVCQKTSQALAGRQLQSCYTVGNKSLAEKECLKVAFKCSKKTTVQSVSAQRVPDKMSRETKCVVGEMSSGQFV